MSQKERRNKRERGRATNKRELQTRKSCKPEREEKSTARRGKKKRRDERNVTKKLTFF